MWSYKGLRDFLRIEKTSFYGYDGYVYTVCITLDYEYRHEKGTDLVLVPRSMGCINETVKLQDVYSTN